MDHAAWLKQSLNEPDDKAGQDVYKYFMRPDPDMRNFLGKIETEQDELTGTTARFRQARVAMMRGAEANKDVKVYLSFDGETMPPHIRIEKAKDLQGWYQGKGAAQATSRERPCMSDAILTEPYGGFCTVGCAFCYINSGFKGYRGTGLITTPVGYGEQIGRQLDKMKTASAGYFSSFTDPFLPLEKYYRNTRTAATAFADRGLPVFFLSRLKYPDWAFDLLKRNPYSYAQKSINTCDPEDWKKLSPGAQPLLEHIEEIRELRRQGIYTSIQVNPIIPGVTEIAEIKQLFEMLAAVGNNHVIVKFVEAGYNWAPAMIQRLKQRFGDNRGGVFESLFTDNMGGQKCVDEQWRMEAHRELQPHATKLGMTYATCYEYEYIDRAPDGTLNSKRTRSVGKQFLTADQCHGKRVPMFTRIDTAVPFHEVAECPPSGCLSCGDDDPEGRGACGSLLFGAAKSNKLKDFKHSVYERGAQP
jgi:DNA repair photolyase